MTLFSPSFCQAQTHVNKIEAQLRGVLMKKSRGLPLSVEGHVSHLIKVNIPNTPYHNKCTWIHCT